MKQFRVGRNMGRGIGGFDVLVASRGGLEFTHPSFLQDRPWRNERVFEADRSTCELLIAAIGECFLVTTDGKRAT